MANVPLRAIMELLGHKSMAMTIRYSHLAPDFQKDSVERLDKGNYAVNSPSTSLTRIRRNSVERKANPQRGQTATIDATSGSGRVRDELVSVA